MVAWLCGKRQIVLRCWRANTYCNQNEWASKKGGHDHDSHPRVSNILLVWWYSCASSMVDNWQPLTSVDMNGENFFFNSCVDLFIKSAYAVRFLRNVAKAMQSHAYPIIWHKVGDAVLARFCFYLDPRLTYLRRLLRTVPSARTYCTYTYIHVHGSDNHLLHTLFSTLRSHRPLIIGWLFEVISRNPQGAQCHYDAAMTSLHMHASCTCKHLESKLRSLNLVPWFLQRRVAPREIISQCDDTGWVCRRRGRAGEQQLGPVHVFVERSQLKPSTWSSSPAGL